METIKTEIGLDGIAIIGMAGRFPGAKNVEEFWQNLCDGRESITFLSPDEDKCMALDPTLQDNHHYVPAGAFLEGVDFFDASFFGYNAREAQIIDPQHRLFLECAWEVLEQAGYDSHQYKGRVGVYAGAGMSTYMLDHIYPNRNLEASMGSFQTMISNEKDFLATRISYKLGLKGPSITVQTGCSTSLAAVALGCQSLLSYQCDMALAGGVSIPALEKGGYLYEVGGVGSPDGHCRAFDENAQGTLFGNGLGIVMLKRLEDAVTDNDQIYAVIKGIAINNDGDLKMGYTAPSLEGQTEVISEALELAAVQPETIGYIETHGTGTHLGDPIEVAALTQAFRTQTKRKSFCAIGSVKTNIGHLDAAAGVVGLIKTSLILKHKIIPPSLNFTQPNPQIDFANSPFYVNTELAHWPEGPTPRRAGVSAFGIGGTNVHAVLEEFLFSEKDRETNRPTLLVLSAKTNSALETATTNLVEHLQSRPETTIADVAYTLQVGRRAFTHRRMVVVETVEDAIESLQCRDPQKVISVVQKPGDTSLAFVFPGHGVEYLNMGRQLYEGEPVYRKWVDYCSELLMPQIGLDLRLALFPQETQADEAAKLLEKPQIAQIALFVTEYAMTSLLKALGIQPKTMLGYSQGEYVAACVAGVISLEDALFLVAERGRLIQEEMPKGAMLSIAMSESDTRDRLGAELSLAAVNGPSLCVVAGPEPAIAALAKALSKEGVENRRIHVSHAFHSSMIKPIKGLFRQAVRKIKLHPPSIPYISCTTGTWITSDEVTDPEYWVRHFRQPVRFSKGLQTLLSKPGCVVIEVGPRQTLLSLLKQHVTNLQRPLLAVPTMRHHLDQKSDPAILLSSLGKLWLAGIEIHFSRLYPQQRRRVLLPTYPFERRRFWIEASKQPSSSLVLESNTGKDEDTALDMDEAERQMYLRANLLNEYIGPRTETEHKVASIWQEYLGSQEIGIYDNFFELGGHSLLAIRLTARLRETFHMELSERSLYHQPTVAALSEAIDKNRRGLSRIVTISRDQPLLASWHQRWRWICDQHHPEQADINNIAMAWELTGNLDMALFEKSINELVKRHEALRTTFEVLNNQLIQKIVPVLTVSLSMIDLTHLPEADREAEMLKRASQQGRTPFDMLSSFPLWEMTLYKLAENRHAWILLAHQSIWDGISIHKAMDEMKIILDATTTGQSWSLPELPIQFADLVHWEQQRFQGDTLNTSLAYWRQKLTGNIAPLHLPTDYPRTEEYALSRIQELHIPKHLTKQLKDLGKEQGTTLYMTLLATFKVLYHTYTGLEDILACTAVTNRDRPEIEPLIAPLANTVALRTDLSGNPTFLEVLNRVRETVIGAITHRDIPFPKILQEIRPDLYTEHNPFGWLLVVQYEPGDYPELGGLSNTSRFWIRRSLSDMYIAIYDHGEHIELIWEYDTHLLDDGTITKMMDNYLALVGQIASDLNKTLLELAGGSLSGASAKRRE